MNQLKGIIQSVTSSSLMSIVDVKISEDIFSAIVLETPESAPYLKEGSPITILFKETEVSIAKNLSGHISLQNRIKSKISSIDKDTILSQVKLEYHGQVITSIISTRSAERLALKKGDDVEWLVKTNEISLRWEKI